MLISSEPMKMGKVQWKEACHATLIDKKYRNKHMFIIHYNTKANEHYVSYKKIKGALKNMVLSKGVCKYSNFKFFSLF